MCVFTGAVSKPYVKTLATKNGIQLQCEVLGTSSGLKLNISLWDSSGNKIADKKLKDTERGGNYILNTIVTRSDNYNCVATMEELSHKASNDIYVSVPGEFLCV